MVEHRPDAAASYVLRCRERVVTAADVECIRALIRGHPEFGRVALAVELCQAWDWRRADGAWNHRACRDLLLHLREKGEITLPPCSQDPGQRLRESTGTDWRPSDLDPQFPLQEVIVRPIQFAERGRWQQLMARYHYLGFRNTVGDVTF